jgi:hypothetical protein
MNEKSEDKWDDDRGQSYKQTFLLFWNIIMIELTSVLHVEIRIFLSAFGKFFFRYLSVFLYYVLTHVEATAFFAFALIVELSFKNWLNQLRALLDLWISLTVSTEVNLICVFIVLKFICIFVFMWF